MSCLIRAKFTACSAMLCLLLTLPTRGTPPPMVVPSQEATTQPTSPGEQSSFFGQLSRTQYFMGDAFGVRPALSKFGLTLTLTETSELLGNVSGGNRQGFDYDGLTTATLQLDTQRAFGLRGGTFNASALQIHGRNLSADHLDTLQTASGIEADRATRLWELWYQQKFLEEDRLDIKVGQQSLDQEFMVSQNASLFVNTMFGWPMLPSADLPGGGPAYPLSALGVRVRSRPADGIAFLAGIFNASPVSNNFGDPQQQNASGTTFPLNGGALVIAEVQYTYPALGGMVSPDQAEQLAGVYKIGFWYDSQTFADQALDRSGRSLANPLSDGNPHRHSGNYAFYGVIDKQIWLDPNDPDGDRGVSFFTRLMGTPLTDRNLIDFSLNAGLVFREPFLHRTDDAAGIGVGYAHVSSRAADLDRATGFYTHAPYPSRGGETFIEAMYLWQVTPWCQIQPDIQYMFNPGAGVPNPGAPGRRINDELVVGVRVNIAF